MFKQKKNVFKFYLILLKVFFFKFAEPSKIVRATGTKPTKRNTDDKQKRQKTPCLEKTGTAPDALDKN